METLGVFLQQEREQRGITLEELASQTRISLKMLLALEANDFKQIPSEVIARGFVRSYARYLGINEDHIFKKFQESASQFYAKISPSEVYQDLPSQRVSRPRSWPKLIVGAAVSGLVIFGGMVLYKQSPLLPKSVVQDPMLPPARATSQDETLPQASGVETTVVEMQQVITSTTLPIEPAVDAEEIPTAKAVDPSVPTPVAQITSGLNHLILLVEATDRSWVMAHIDDQIIKEVLLQPGEKVQWQAKTKFLLTVGNAGGVKIEFNGKTLDPLGPQGKVVKNITLMR